MVLLNDAWLERVRAWCDPVFDEADCGFVWNGQSDALLWEADPARFAARYPDSGIVESYGGQWGGVHCIDFWAYLDKADFARISVEGWNLPELFVEVRGHPDLDGSGLARVFAMILGVSVSAPDSA
jgi:hypothetical protein